MKFDNILINKSITLENLKSIAAEGYGPMVKAVVDLKKEIMVIGAELHVDEETLLIDTGSSQSDLWGINIYPEKDSNDWIIFDSMVNIRPTDNNYNRGVEDQEKQDLIKKLVSKLVIR